jgi:hypothetical protein
MSHENRNRVIVEAGAESPLYADPRLPGWEYAGLVSAGPDKGPLLRNKHTGIYVMSIGGAVRSLDQRKVRAALDPAAKKLDGGKRVNVYLDESSLNRAAQLGGGNVSEGIRIALAQAVATDR